MTHRGKPAKTDAARKKTPSKARSHKNTVAKKKSAVTKKVPLTKKPSAKAGAPRKTTRQSNKRIGRLHFQSRITSARSRISSVQPSARRPSLSLNRGAR